MDRPRQVFTPPLPDGFSYMLVGAHAANVFAPERTTQDIEIIVLPEQFTLAETAFERAGWRKENDLVFASSQLGLFGSTWTTADRSIIGVLSSRQPWLVEAFSERDVRNARNTRVIPLPYLVLMKLDSARAVDQGDLSRILGRLGDEAVERTAAVVAQYHPDSQIVEDLRQYTHIGRWEYLSEAELRLGRDAGPNGTGMIGRARR